MSSPRCTTWKPWSKASKHAEWKRSREGKIWVPRSTARCASDQATGIRAAYKAIPRAVGSCYEYQSPRRACAGRWTAGGNRPGNPRALSAGPRFPLREREQETRSRPAVTSSYRAGKVGGPWEVRRVPRSDEDFQMRAAVGTGFGRRMVTSDRPVARAGPARFVIRGGIRACHTDSTRRLNGRMADGENTTGQGGRPRGNRGRRKRVTARRTREGTRPTDPG